jgi:transketolase N-terminal domain/subunit
MTGIPYERGCVIARISADESVFCYPEYCCNCNTLNDLFFLHTSTCFKKKLGCGCEEQDWVPYSKTHAHEGRYCYLCSKCFFDRFEIVSVSMFGEASLSVKHCKRKMAGTQIKQNFDT